MLLEKAASFGHNMKLCPADRLRLMFGSPTRGEPADFLDLRADSEQRRDGA
jgi:hypothetical protein